MLMSPELSQYWAKVLTSQMVSIKGSDFVSDLRRALVNGDALTAEQQSVVEQASDMLGLQRPSE